MDQVAKSKAKKREYKTKLAAALRRIESLEYELALIRTERDKAIGEKCLATAKLKEQAEELTSFQARATALENSYVTMKIEHVNLKSNFESLKDDYDISKKMIQLRDREIQNLTKSQDSKRKNHPDTPTRMKETLRPPVNKNIKPFPSTSFSFNLIHSNKNSFTSSMRDDDH